MAVSSSGFGKAGRETGSRHLGRLFCFVRKLHEFCKVAVLVLQKIEGHGNAGRITGRRLGKGEVSLRLSLVEDHLVRSQYLVVILLNGIHGIVVSLRRLLLLMVMRFTPLAFVTT